MKTPSFIVAASVIAAAISGYAIRSVAVFDAPSHGSTGWPSFTTMITATPEPASWAMMILGIGAIGAMFRRRRAGAAA